MQSSKGVCGNGAPPTAHRPRQRHNFPPDAVAARGPCKPDRLFSAQQPDLAHPGPPRLPALRCGQLSTSVQGGGGALTTHNVCGTSAARHRALCRPVSGFSQCSSSHGNLITGHRASGCSVREHATRCTELCGYILGLQRSRTREYSPSAQCGKDNLRVMVALVHCKLDVDF